VGDLHDQLVPFETEDQVDAMLPVVVVAVADGVGEKLVDRQLDVEDDLQGQTVLGAMGFDLGGREVDLSDIVDERELERALGTGVGRLLHGSGVHWRARDLYPPTAGLALHRLDDNALAPASDQIPAARDCKSERRRAGAFQSIRRHDGCSSIRRLLPLGAEGTEDIGLFEDAGRLDVIGSVEPALDARA
ncbi:MAG: hypothetical protein OXF79_25655, partial [Chloroflexi bacterium]|nr:hypothetical protein [Chloroflexota bacterium]